MADAPEIKVKLTAEDTGVSAAIKELTSQLKTLKKQQDETAASGLSLKNAFAGIVAAAGAIEFGRIGKDAFDSAVNIGKMADKTGLTTQALSVFHHVAEETGVSTEAVDKALVRGAKSITEFEQGSAKAAKGFQLLNITQKDFAGLKPDQKIALVTERLGHMAAGFQKATATQLIFSKGGADFIPVANAIAGEGFDKVTASVSKLGLLLDQETTDAFRSAKASMQELTDVGKGMATQFEAGLLPAISDVGEALVDSLTQGGVSFQSLGKYAGDAVKGIAFIFLGLGQTIGTIAASIADVFQTVFKEITNTEDTFLTAADQAVHGHLKDSLGTLEQGARNSTGIVREEVDRQKAIYKSLGDSFKADYYNLFPSDAEEARRKKERIARLRPEKQAEAPEVTAAALPTDAAAKAALSLLEKQLQDELAIHRAYAKQTEQIDKESYDQGEISLHEYFERRRAAVLSDTEEELAILEKGLAAAKAAVTRAEAEKKRGAATPKEADRQEATRLGALQKVDELETKITELRVNSGTKIQALNDEQFKAQQANQEKVLAFQKEIAVLQGKQEEVTKAEIAQEAEKLRVELAQAGQSKQQIDQEIAQFTELKMAQAEFKDAETKLQQDRKAFDIEKQRIELEAKTRKIGQLEAEKELNDLIAARLPLLRADAQAEVSAAQKTGNQDNVAAAQTAAAGVENLKVSAVSLGDTLRGSISNDFGSFFLNLGRNTASAANQFRSLAASVVASLEQILVKLLLVKLFGGGEGGGGGGGLLGGLFGLGKAEGGLIQGPGGPKSDSIPIRASPGEFMVKADAVSAFGVHNLEAINRGLKIPSLAQLSLPKFSEGGLVGSSGGGDSNIHLGIGLDEGLILRHLSSKAAGNIILNHLSNNPKAAQKALSRSD
jgi:hypothetical protein